MPAKIGEGYNIKEDEHTGAEYGGAMEGMKAKDEEERVIIILNSKLTKMPMKYRVVEKNAAPTRLGGRDRRQGKRGIHVD